MISQNMEVMLARAENRSVANSAAEVAPEEKILVAFSNALNPDWIEQFLVEQLSRRAAQTRDFDAALDALRHQGEAAFLSVLSTSDRDAVPALALARASVLGSERSEALLRQGLASSRDFLRTLQAIRDVRAASQKESSSFLMPDPRFTSEQACCAYLLRRYVHGSCGCRRCAAVSEGCFVAARTSWQCARCRAQTGLRSGTCMERSALPLTKWFAAIRILLLSPTIATEELALVLKIDRLQTVRTMIKRIRAAKNSHDPSAALAGLDALYFGFG